MPTKAKQDILKDEFSIQIPDYGRGLFEEMCNLSLGIREEGIQEGILRGITKLMEKGLSDDQIMYLLDVTMEQMEEAKGLLTKV